MISKKGAGGIRSSLRCFWYSLSRCGGISDTRLQLEQNVAVARAGRDKFPVTRPAFSERKRKRNVVTYIYSPWGCNQFIPKICHRLMTPCSSIFDGGWSSQQHFPGLYKEEKDKRDGMLQLLDLLYCTVTLLPAAKGLEERKRQRGV